jgi:hypothetical protein
VITRLLFIASLLLSLVVASPSWATTPAHDATTDTAGSKFANATNPSFTHTPTGGACPNSIAIISVGWSDNTGTLSSVTYGGAAMTGEIGTMITISPTLWQRMFYYLNSGTGAVTVQANFSENINAGSIRVSTYCNVNQSSPLGSAFVANAGSGTTATVDVTSGAAGELVVDAVTTTPRTLTVGAGQTQRYQQTDSSNYTNAGSQEAGAATVTMSWTISSSAEWGIKAVALKPSMDGGQKMRKAVDF